MKAALYYALWLSVLICCKSEVNANDPPPVSSELIVEGHAIPPKCLSPLHNYPNPLNITEEERRKFHPVVKFPKIWIDEDGSKRRKKVDNYRVLDLQTVAAADELASEEERVQRRGTKKSRWSRHEMTVDRLGGYAVGRYDENRVNMYASDMFDDSTHAIDGYTGQRTVHIGIDLDGPLHTKVFSFAKGAVHSAGYNADLGDYGNVIVIEHDLGDAVNGKERKIWALYGHLNEASVQNMPPGKPIKRGQYLGRFGDIHENGGWRIPHVHFALSIEPPDSHDMPGVVSMEDRPRALVQYPDPRWVLGELY
jgi:murein DD-endopeptidase MepM/ murein hydrolase activator NlpD